MSEPTTALERLRAAAAEVPRGERVPVHRGPGHVTMDGHRHVAVIAADVLEVCKRVREHTRITQDLMAGCQSVPGPTQVHIQADDVCHLVEQAEPKGA